MKDFDEERTAAIDELGDRSFQVGGETFTRRPTLRPEVVQRLGSLFDGEVTPAESLKRGDELILALIESEGHERWRALREREDDALDNKAIQEVMNWLIAEATGRPTIAPSLSTPGREQSGTGSTDKSSLRAVEG